ncbi:FkbM family methyltransferase [Actinokineospora sp. HUAS TT18]|uniref:FkbM family methyltransferase n=1 Tax=Actinokineospora sp. HUAS TT18 TaxID=3447451 RepID=UPI003F526B0B
MKSALLRFPGVARARVDRSETGRLTARVLPWGRPSGNAETGALSELAEISPTETRFLHDEIFVAESYLQGGVVLREGAVVFDVGANIGMFTLFVTARCPSARVFAFEPVPEVFDRLRTNVEGRGIPAHLFEIGLSEQDERIRFNFYPEISIMSCRADYAAFDNERHLIQTYVDHERAAGPQGRETHLDAVEAIIAKDFEYDARECLLRRTSAVIDEVAVPVIDLLKIDVQRAELDVLRGIDAAHWPLVQQVTMEVHDEPGLPTAGRVDTVRDLLAEQGFDVQVTEPKMLAGTGRFSVQAIRPGYADDPRPIVAAAGNGRPLDGGELRTWLGDRLPADLVPAEVEIVSTLV